MIVVDGKRCIGCGRCVEDCIAGNLKIEEGACRVAGSCFQCGHCVAVCPHEAVSIPDYPADDVVEYSRAAFQVPTENLLNAFKFRRSIRRFEDRPISMEHLHILMDAAAHTPTAKNTMANRFVFIQDSLEAFKTLIWSELHTALINGDETPIDENTLDRFFALREAEPSEDFLFRNAPAVLMIQAPDPVDAGLAASAIEMMAQTLGIGVLYDGYLRRVIVGSELAAAYTDSDFEEKPLWVCMLLGYQDVEYRRTAPRRNPSVVLR